MTELVKCEICNRPIDSKLGMKLVGNKSYHPNCFSGGLSNKDFPTQTSEYFTPIQQQLIYALKNRGAMSRNEICEAFGFKTHIVKYVILSPSKKKYHVKLKQYEKRTTIYDNLVKLEKKGIVEKFSKNNGKVGASLKMWKLTTGGSE